jgi:hypothetical protein
MYNQLRIGGYVMIAVAAGCCYFFVAAFAL